MAKQKKEKARIPDDLKDSAHKIWLAGLGALAVAEEEGTRLFKTLVEKGEKFEVRGKKQFEKGFEKVKDQVEDVKDKAESRWESLGSGMDEKVAEVLNKMGVPGRDEIKTLTKRVEELTNKVDKLKPASRSTRTAKKS